MLHFTCHTLACASAGCEQFPGILIVCILAIPFHVDFDPLPCVPMYFLVYLSPTFKYGHAFVSSVFPCIYILCVGSNTEMHLLESESTSKHGKSHNENLPRQWNKINTRIQSFILLSFVDLKSPPTSSFVLFKIPCLDQATAPLSSLIEILTSG